MYLQAEYDRPKEKRVEAIEYTKEHIKYVPTRVNVSRISYKIKNKKFPTDEEIWAD